MSMWHHVTQISPDTLLQLESMCILCVLAGICPHTFTIRCCYLMWNMICWTELYGSALTKAIGLLFFTCFFSKWQGPMCVIMDGVVVISALYRPAISFPIKQYLSLCCTEHFSSWFGWSTATCTDPESYCENLTDHKSPWKRSLLKPSHLVFEVLPSFFVCKY